MLYINQWIVGGNARKLDPNRDAIVITGGSSGLGLKISALFAVRGYRVIILDLNAPPQSLSLNTTFKKCDVADETNVESVKNEIILEHPDKSLVLINNAGTAHGTPILELDSKDIEKTVKVNLLGHFWTIRSFLPEMLRHQRGHIVTISSVLGYIGPAGLTSYCASKGGLNTMHDSLAHELKQHDGVRTLLVTVGQMDSTMFNGVDTPSNFLAPILQTSEVALRVVEAVEQGRGGEFSMPLYASLIHLTKIIPMGVVDLVRKTFGMDKAAICMSKKEK